MRTLIACSVTVSGRDLQVSVPNYGTTTFKTMRDLRIGLASFVESRSGLSRNNLEIALV